MMEEEKLVKKELVNDNEEKIVPTNENNQKNNSNKKGLIIGIVIAILLIIAGEVIYFCFIKKDDKTVDNKENNDQVVDNNSEDNDEEQEDDRNKTEYKITSKGAKVIINNRELNIKIKNGNLYINEKEVAKLSYDEARIIVASKYAVISVQGQIDFYIYGINENGELIKIEGTPQCTDDSPCNRIIGIENVRVENDKIIGEKVDFGERDDEYNETPIEFVYEKNQVTVKNVE